MRPVAELISLALTSPTIIFSLGVVYIWFPKAWDAAKTPSDSRTEIQWFILGVMLGFLGAACDNFYWALAWTSHYLGMKGLTEILFENGVYSNIPFRQFLGLSAAYCHLRAALHKGSLSMRLAGAVSCILAVGYVLGLIYLKFNFLM